MSLITKEIINQSNLQILSQIQNRMLRSIGNKSLSKDTRRDLIADVRAIDEIVNGANSETNLEGGIYIKTLGDFYTNTKSKT